MAWTDERTWETFTSLCCSFSTNSILLHPSRLLWEFAVKQVHRIHNKNHITIYIPSLKICIYICKIVTRYSGQASFFHFLWRCTPCFVIHQEDLTFRCCCYWWSWSSRKQQAHSIMVFVKNGGSKQKAVCRFKLEVGSNRRGGGGFRKKSGSLNSLVYRAHMHSVLNIDSRTRPPQEEWYMCKSGGHQEVYTNLGKGDWKWVVLSGPPKIWKMWHICENNFLNVRYAGKKVLLYLILKTCFTEIHFFH